MACSIDPTNDLILNIPNNTSIKCCGDECTDTITTIRKVYLHKDIDITVDSVLNETEVCPELSCPTDADDNVIIINVTDIKQYDKLSIRTFSCLGIEIYDIVLTEPILSIDQGISMLVEAINTTYTDITAEWLYPTDKIKLRLNKLAYPCTGDLYICNSECISEPEIIVNYDENLYVNLTNTECDPVCKSGDIDIYPFSYNVDVIPINIVVDTCTNCGDMIDRIRIELSRPRPFMSVLHFIHIYISSTAVGPFNIYIDNVLYSTVPDGTTEVTLTRPEGSYVIRVESIDVPNCSDTETVVVTTDLCYNCILNVSSDINDKNILHINYVGQCTDPTNITYVLNNSNGSFSGTLEYISADMWRLPSYYAIGLNTIVVTDSNTCTRELVLQLTSDTACDNLDCRMWRYINLVYEAISEIIAAPGLGYSSIFNSTNLHEYWASFLSPTDQIEFNALNGGCFAITTYTSGTNSGVVLTPLGSLNVHPQGIIVCYNGDTLVRQFYQSTLYTSTPNFTLASDTNCNIVNPPSYLWVPHNGEDDCGTGARICGQDETVPVICSDINQEAIDNGTYDPLKLCRKIDTYYIGTQAAIVAFDCFFAKNILNIYDGVLTLDDIIAAPPTPLHAMDPNVLGGCDCQQDGFLVVTAPSGYITVEIYDSNAWYRVFCGNTYAYPNNISFDTPIPYIPSPVSLKNALNQDTYQSVGFFLLTVPPGTPDDSTVTLDWTFSAAYQLGFRFSLYRVPDTPSFVVKRGDLIKNCNLPIVNCNHNNLFSGLTHRSCEIPQAIPYFYDSTGYRISHSNSYWETISVSKYIRTQFINVNSSDWGTSDQGGNTLPGINNGKLRIRVNANEKVLAIITSDEWNGDGTLTNYTGDDNWGEGHNNICITCQAGTTPAGPDYSGNGNTVDFTGDFLITLQFDII